VLSDVVVIASIGSQDPAQMRLTLDDEMVHVTSQRFQIFEKRFLIGW
jgi:hypothetical protein